MLKFKALIVSLVFLVILCVGGAFVLPSFVDWNKYKEPIQNNLTEKLGYNAKISGDLSFDVLPYPRLVVGETKVFSDKKSEQSLLSFDTLYVAVKLVPLLSGKVQVDNVRIIHPSIYVVKDEYGQFNFMTEKLQTLTGSNRSDLDSTKDRDVQKQSDAMGLDSVSIENFEIEDGMIVFKDMVASKDYKVEKFSSAFSAQTLSGPYDLKGHFEWQGESYNVAFRSERLTKNATTLPVQFEVSMGQAKTQFKYSGLVGLRMPLDLQGEFQVSAADVNKTVLSVGGNAFSNSALPLSVGGLVTINSDGVQVDRLSGMIMNHAFQGDVEVDGLSSDFSWNNTKPPKLLLNLEIENLGDLQKLIGDAASPVSLKSENSKGEGASKKSAAATLIPETLVLSKDLNFEIVTRVKGAEYRAQKLSEIESVFKKSGNVIDVSLSAAKVGVNGSASLSGKLTYLSDSRAGGNQVVYSDPVLKGKVNLKQLNLVPFADGVDETKKSLIEDMFKSFDFATSYEVQPVKAKITDANFSAGSIKGVSTVEYSLDKKGQGRPTLVVGVNLESLDADRLMSLGRKENPVPKELQKNSQDDIKNVTKGFDLPFDLSGQIHLGQLRYMERDLSEVQIKAGMKNKTLDIDGISVRLNQDTVVAVSGKIGDIFEVSQMDLSVDVQSKDVQRLLDILKIKQDAVKVPLRGGSLKGLVKGDMHNINFTANVDMLDTNVEASGVLKNVVEKISVSELKVRLGHNDFERFVQMFVVGYDAPIAPRSKLDLYVDVASDNGKVYNLKQFKAQVGKNSLDADALIDVSDKIPNVKGYIKGHDLVLSDLLNGDGSSQSTIKTDSKKGDVSKQKTGIGDARWSRTAINTAWMHSADVDMKFSFDHLVYNQWDLNNLSGQIVLNSGVLDFYDVKSELHGGSLGVSGKLTSSANPREPVSFNVVTKMSEVSFPGLIKSMDLPQVIKGEAGKVNFGAEISSTGLSPAALVFGLTGKGSLDGEGIVIRGFDLTKLSKAVAKESSEFKQWKRLGEQAIKGVVQGGQTRFDAMLGTFVISEGIVKTEDLTMQSQDAVVRSYGHVNLPQWSVDIDTIIDITEPEDAPNLSYHYSGPIGSPVANMNAQNLLQYGISQAVDKLIEDKAGEIINKILKTPEPSNDNSSTEGVPQKPPKPEDVFKGLLKDVISR